MAAFKGKAGLLAIVAVGFGASPARASWLGCSRYSDPSADDPGGGQLVDRCDVGSDFSRPPASSSSVQGCAFGPESWMAPTVGVPCCWAAVTPAARTRSTVTTMAIGISGCSTRPRSIPWPVTSSAGTSASPLGHRFATGNWPSSMDRCGQQTRRTTWTSLSSQLGLGLAGQAVFALPVAWPLALDVRAGVWPYVWQQIDGESPSSPGSTWRLAAVKVSTGPAPNRWASGPVCGPGRPVPGCAGCPPARGDWNCATATRPGSRILTFKADTVYPSVKSRPSKPPRVWRSARSTGTASVRTAWDRSPGIPRAFR